MKRAGVFGVVSSGWTARLVLLGSVLALIPGSRAVGATAATMTIGEPQPSNVKASKVQKGASPAVVIQLLSVTRSSTDAATGMSSSKRASGAPDTLIITKYYDGGSAVLEQAAATNEVLREVTIAFETAMAAGTSSTNPKVKGNTAKGSSSGMAAGSSASKTAQVLLLKNVQVDEVVQTRNMQRITIEYQSLEVTYTSGKTAAATDDWETP